MQEEYREFIQEKVRLLSLLIVRDIYAALQLNDVWKRFIAEDKMTEKQRMDAQENLLILFSATSRCFCDVLLI